MAVQHSSGFSCDVTDVTDKEWTYECQNDLAFRAQYKRANRIGDKDVVMLLLILCTQSWTNQINPDEVEPIRLKDEVHKLRTDGCPLSMLDLLLHLHPELASNVTWLEFNGPVQGRLPGPIMRIASLEKLEFKQFGSVEQPLDSGDWPHNLTQLKFSHSDFEELPNLSILSVEKLELYSNANMNRLSSLSFYTSLSILIIDRCANLKTLPDKIFKQNKKLKNIQLLGSEEKTLSTNTLQGLAELEVLSMEGINRIPFGFFANAPELTHITWTSDCTLKSPMVQFPAQMLTSANQRISHFEFKAHSCYVSIHVDAFSPMQYRTVRHLSIQGTNLGSEELLDNFSSKFKNLDYLDLRDNGLQEISKSVAFLAMMPDLRLSANPWTCQCPNLEAMTILKDAIDDYIHIKLSNCSNHANSSDISVEEAHASLGCTNSRPDYTVFYAVFGLCGSLAILMITVFILKKKKYYLYNHPTFSKLFPVQYEDDDLAFDAFLSYAEPDRDLAFAIRSKLMNDMRRRFSVSIHDVNFMPGVPIRQNMITNIQSSRRFLAVLTANFLNSSNCIDEFVIANESHKR